MVVVVGVVVVGLGSLLGSFVGPIAPATPKHTSDEVAPDNSEHQTQPPQLVHWFPAEGYIKETIVIKIIITHCHIFTVSKTKTICKHSSHHIVISIGEGVRGQWGKKIKETKLDSSKLQFTLSYRLCKCHSYKSCVPFGRGRE